MAIRSTKMGLLTLNIALDQFGPACLSVDFQVWPGLQATLPMPTYDVTSGIASTSTNLLQNNLTVTVDNITKYMQ